MFLFATLFKKILKKSRPTLKRKKQRERKVSAACSTMAHQQPAATSNISSSVPTASQQSIQEEGKTVIDGRIYHDRQDVAYIMPEDDEDKDRLHQQHWMLRLAFGGNFDAPVEKELQNGITVLDSACGPATWSLEMANAYPHSTFHGVDIAHQFPEQIKPRNCHFQIANITETLPFPDNHFDYIHQRLLVAGLTREGWDKCLAELYRVLKPGGWIELKELDLQHATTSGGPAQKRLCTVFVDLIKARGIEPGIVQELPSMLEKIMNVRDIHSRTVTTRMLDGTKLGQLAWEDFVSIFEIIKPLLAKLYPAEFSAEEKLAEYIETVRQEATTAEEEAGAGHWVSIWAQKPTNAVTA